MTRTLLTATLMAGLIALPGIARADDPVKSRANASAATFSWFANGAALSQADALALAQAQRIAMAQAWGDGTWICSPAGFGQGSTCYRR
jgi:hypothetical protein